MRETTECVQNVSRLVRFGVKNIPTFLEIPYKSVYFMKKWKWPKYDKAHCHFKYLNESCLEIFPFR